MPIVPRKPKIAAGLIERADHHLLIVLSTHQPNGERRWQFPRDDAKPRESPEAAMRRLAKEKLGVDVQVAIGQPPFLAQRDGREVEMRYFHCGVPSGEPQSRAYAEIRWISKGHLREYEFDELSQPVVDWLLADEAG